MVSKTKNIFNLILFCFIMKKWGQNLKNGLLHDVGNCLPQLLRGLSSFSKKNSRGGDGSRTPQKIFFFNFFFFLGPKRLQKAKKVRIFFYKSKISTFFLEKMWYGPLKIFFFKIFFQIFPWFRMTEKECENQFSIFKNKNFHPK